MDDHYIYIRERQFQKLRLSEPTQFQKNRASQECKEIIRDFGIYIDFFAVIHLFLAGCAFAYIIILTRQSNFSLWCSFFAQISLPSDIFFYIFSFLIFLANFIFAAVMYHVPTPKFIQKILLTVSTILLGLSLFLTTFSFPMSYMIKQSLKDYGDWYTSQLAVDESKSLFFGTYKTLAIARMICILIAVLIFPFVTMNTREEIFAAL